MSCPHCGVAPGHPHRVQCPVVLAEAEELRRQERLSAAARRIQELADRRDNKMLEALVNFRTVVQRNTTEELIGHLTTFARDEYGKWGEPVA